MTCTYYGGSTAKFVTDVLRCGVESISYRPENFAIPGIKALNGLHGINLFADGSNVAYDSGGKGLPKVLTCDLVTPLKLQDSWHSRTTKAINIEFLASCKLLDLQAYAEALKDNPSPVAFYIAIQRAKESLKPDFPRTRKGGVNLLDFIEELVYFDLESVKSYCSDLHFITPNYRFQELRSQGTKELFVEFLRGHGLRFARDAYQGNGSSILDVNYFEKLGLLKVSSFQMYEAFMSGPEAFQRAVRETLGNQAPEATTLELPSDLLGDD